MGVEPGDPAQWRLTEQLRSHMQRRRSFAVRRRHTAGSGPRLKRVRGSSATQ